MRRGGHEQVMVGHGRKRLAQLVSQSLPVVGIRAHLVGLIDNHQVPPGTHQAFPRIFNPGYPGYGCDNLMPFLPRILSIIRPQYIAADHFEVLAELVFQFPLPLEGQIGGRDNQNTLYQAPGFELFQKKTSHDGLAGAGIVREQEPNPWHL